MPKDELKKTIELLKKLSFTKEKFQYFHGIRDITVIEQRTIYKHAS